MNDSFFAANLENLVAPGQIDVIQVSGLPRLLSGGVVRILGRDTISVHGWAFDPRSKQPGVGVVALINGHEHFLTYGGARPDIAAKFDDSSLLKTEFQGALSTDSLTPGKHSLEFFLIGSDGAARYKVADSIVLDLIGFGPESIQPESSLDDSILIEVDDIRCEEGNLSDQRAVLYVSSGAGAVVASGWAFDSRFDQLCGGIFAMLSGKEPYPGIYGSGRPDVALHLGSPLGTTTGYVARIPVCGLPAGEHELRIMAVSADGRRCNVSPATYIAISS